MFGLFWLKIMGIIASATVSELLKDGKVPAVFSANEKAATKSYLQRDLDLVPCRKIYQFWLVRK